MSDDIFARLAAPFPVEVISWRVGPTNADKTQGIALCYIDARDCMDRLDEVCGPAGWQRRHPHVTGTTTCEIDIWVEGRGWITKTDGSGDSDMEAEKGSLSGSFKRCAVNWGIGRYLYSIDAPWVAIEPAGRSQKIKATEYARLRDILNGKKPATARAAKQDDRGKRAADLANEIPDLHAVTECIAWKAQHLAEVGTWPVSWQKKLWSELDAREADLKAEAIANFGAVEARQTPRGAMEPIDPARDYGAPLDGSDSVN